MDLIEVLDTQLLASQIIYSTHSLGCIPLDLVSAIRAVVPAGDVERSSISNSVWAEGDGLSLTPLLFGMGATLLALVVPKFAVLTEGLSDSLLLPGLLRDGGSQVPLPFRFAPGLANARSSALKTIDAEAGRVAMVVDGDPGGVAKKKQLIDAGVVESHIVGLGELTGTPLTTEDFIGGKLLGAAALEAELRWRSVPENVEAPVLPATGKWAAVESWCSQFDKPAPGKVEIAQVVRDLAPTFDPADRVEASLGPALVELNSRLRTILQTQ
jgi:hypothetical protein